MEPHGRDQDHNRESESARGSGGTPTGVRWNPTKEQVNLLEALYRQGIRTPSADQIQQITARLRVFGLIEGKNVFYWFQNHKARQRQKQKEKQATVARVNRHFDRFFHELPFSTAGPLFPSTDASHLQYPWPCRNMVCGPCYIPMQGEPSTSTSASRRTSRLEAIQEKRKILPAAAAGASCNRVPRNRLVVGEGPCNIGTTDNQETLALFPLTPTGGLKSKDHDDRRVEYSDDRDHGMSGIISFSSSNGQVSSTSCGFEDGCSGDKTFYDFL